MSTQMTIRVDDDLARFVDEDAAAQHRSRADVINRAIRAEVRRRRAQCDAEIYAAHGEAEFAGDAYASWAVDNAATAWVEAD